jgi:rhodanese-related sulfurtransferase
VHIYLRCRKTDAVVRIHRINHLFYEIRDIIFARDIDTWDAKRCVSDIMARKNELENYKNIYLYCLSGSRSELALLQLQSAGLKANIASLTSGLLAWRAGGFAMSESNA